MGKIIVFGDSISYGKWDTKGGWVNRLRIFIDEKYNIGMGGNFQVYNMGIPGEVALRMAERFENELKYRIDPTDKNLVIIAIGVNDSCPNNWMTERQTPENEFKASVKSMIKVARANNCKVVCIGLTPVNASKSKGLKFTNKEAKKYDTFLKELCDEVNTLKLDLFDQLIEQSFPDLLVDSVHPNDAGHALMAEKIIEFLTENKLIEHCL